MAQVRLVVKSNTPDVQNPYLVDVSIDTVFDPVVGVDTDYALARSVLIALNTDRLALPDDVLPDSRDANRRGWWADTNAASIRRASPIGSRLWLMSRSKITGSGAKQGSTIELLRRYIVEALQPFVDSKICTSFVVELRQAGPETITGTVTMIRGTGETVQLEYSDVWAPYA